MAWCVLWFMCCYFPAKIPCTAPTGHQLSDVLWAEIAKWHRALKERLPELGEEIEWKSEKVELKSHPQESFAVARTSRPENPEALQGFHSDNILFVLDEASGIPDEVFVVGEGALSSEGAWAIMAANPTRSQGYFFDSHHKMRHSWETMAVNGETVGRVAKKYIDDMARKYGAESAIYRIRVKGEFAGNPDGVIPLDWIESATRREVEAFGPVKWGLDVARFGDDQSALAKRKGGRLLAPIKTWGGKDLMQTAGLLKVEYDEAKIKPDVIFIDSIGLGSGVVDRCAELGLPVCGINVAESPAIKEQYNRLRDELWFRAREWFEGLNVQIPLDEDLIGELTLPTFKVLSTGKKQVESKDDIKKRAQSPDRADAFCLTFADGGAMNSKPLKYPKFHNA